VKITSKDGPERGMFLVIHPHDRLAPVVPTSACWPGGIVEGQPEPLGVKGSPSPPSKVTPANTKQLSTGVFKDEAVIKVDVF
jgi:hypothetical protein